MIKKIVTDIRKKMFFKELCVDLAIDYIEENNIINIYPEIICQDWLGLGGALTGSTVYNFNKLNNEQRDALLHNYFNELNYSYLRIPVGSTDFSLKSEDDYTFSFGENVKIIKQIIAKYSIEIIATPWSPPSKFKDNNSLYGGKLLRNKYDDYANYLCNCIKDYNFSDVIINYLSVQNEPLANQVWESCYFEIQEYKEFIYKFLIPKLNYTKLILWDHNKENLYNVFNELYEKNSAIVGIGFHWYTGGFYNELKLLKENYPNMLLFETEMCCGFSKYNRIKWIIDAENYLNEIIKGINNGLNVFLDWNMLLNYKGGPNHKRNYCKSPIILNKKENDFIKTPIFYYLKHIGIAGKAKVIYNSTYDRNDELQVVGLKNDKVYITILNKSNKIKDLNIKIKNQLIRDKINKRSIITYVLDYC
ncbi:MAG: hypothetical protein IKG14_01390 [Clostridia bacterium]|nr:hypothetical protein [Clostridia bacterium]